MNYADSTYEAIEQAAHMVSTIKWLDTKLEEFENKLKGNVSMQFTCKRAGGSTVTICIDFNDEQDSHIMISEVKSMLLRRKENCLKKLKEIHD